MDDSLQDLESELKALRPRRPSVLLRAKLERELSPATDSMPNHAAGAPGAREMRRYTTASTFRSWKWAGWPLAAAAGVALLVSLGVWQGQPSGADAETPALAQSSAPPLSPIIDSAAALVPPPADRRLAAAGSPETYRPVRAANVLYDLQDEGLVLLDDNTPARRVRARYLDTYTWKNPASNSSLRWSVPRDEVRVLPASFH